MDVAEELLDLDRSIDRSYVERRLIDWHRRLDALYADIQTWLPVGWSMSDGGSVSILEDLMVRFDVPRQALPRKDLFHHGTRVGRIEPRGLWIIGANGRVDMILSAEHSIIVDRAQSFDLPQWTITPLRDRLKGRPLTVDSFRAHLA